MRAVSSRVTRVSSVPLDAGGGQRLAMLGVRLGEGLVAVRLPRLGEQDQRRRVGGLGAERQVEQDEGVGIEMGQPPDVERDPAADEHGLDDQEDGGAEEAGEALRLAAEPVAAEDRGQVRMRPVEAVEVLVVV